MASPDVVDATGAAAAMNGSGANADGDSIRSVLVIGHGVMGKAVAKTFVDAGFETMVLTRNPTGFPDRLVGARYLDALPRATPQLIIEMVAETLDAKRAVYADVEQHYAGSDYWLATGTSGLDLNVLSALLKRPERFVAIHYYMPAAVVATVEVAAGPETPPHAVDEVAAALRRTGKDPLVMYKPVVGFIVNRLQHAILNEAYRLIESGISTAADIDRAARAMLGPRMCINGLIQQKDISGLRIHADAQRSIVPTLNREATACALLQDMVARGETGLDAGRGFYDWTGQSPKAVRQATSDRVGALLTYLADDAARADLALRRTADAASRRSE